MNSLPDCKSAPSATMYIVIDSVGHGDLGKTKTPSGQTILFRSGNGVERRVSHNASSAEHVVPLFHTDYRGSARHSLLCDSAWCVFQRHASSSMAIPLVHLPFCQESNSVSGPR